MNNEESLRLYGTTEAQQEVLHLRAGALSCDFECGGVRHVRWGRTEIVRGVSYLFRDRDWGTVQAEVVDVRVQATSNAFVLQFGLRIRTPDGVLNASAHVEGTGAGMLRFAVAATPERDLVTNRCGFVVLHPAACAGKPLSVEHTNGKIEEVGFPLEISPSQPVFDIRALTYSPAPGMTLNCRLEAALPHDPAGKFEMEDQRNWSDASFKTYVASLLDAWPYKLAAGMPLVQRVEFAVTGAPSESPDAAGSDRPRLLRLGTPVETRLPALGVGVPPGIREASPDERAALRSLGAAWWIVDAELGAPGLVDDLRELSGLRKGLQVRVQVDAVVPAELSPDEAASEVRRVCDLARLHAEAIRLLPAPYLKSFQPSDVWPDVPPLELYADAARRRFPEARVGGGMFTYFTELNRRRPVAAALDFVGHATCPTVHAVDDTSVMQTLEAMESILRSVALICPGTAYRLGPSTIASPRNPYGIAPVSNEAQRRTALASSDPRHRGQFGAAWTAAYAAACAGAGLEVLALHHSHGPCGPCAGSEGTVPAWDVMKALARAGGARVVPIEGLADGLAGLAWEGDDGVARGLLANLTAGRMSVSIDGRAAGDLGAFGTLTFVADR